MEIAILVLALGIFVGIIVWAVKYTKKINNRKHEFYAEFANKRGFTHRQEKYMLAMLNTLEGEIAGCPVRIFEKMEGSGKSKQVVTRIVVDNTPWNFDFRMGKEHFFSKAGKMLGMQDIEFGDAEFDKNFLLKSKDEPQFRDLMTLNIQNELRMIKDDLRSSIYHTSGSLAYMNYGPLAKQDQFDSFERVVNFMEKLLSEKRR